MKKIFILMVVLFLTGCSTSLVPVNQAKDIPQDRLLKHKTALESGAQLTIVRDSGIVGSACYAVVYVDGSPSAKLETKEKTTLFLEPGEYSIGVNLDGTGLCAYGNARVEREIVLKKGQHKYMRIFTQDDGNMDLLPTTVL
ncbi:hypothetical protein [Yersinia rohdei]|uniref:hypothetical protein n=1 Tax=Yersinia rohdei TaxID=29485 RepID=UPI0011A2D2D7|nr:hypothetical protein [Yersinia rohdei]